MANEAGFAVFETAIGACGVAWQRDALIRLQLPEGTLAATRRRLSAKLDAATEGSPPDKVAAAIGKLERYFAGERIELDDIAIDLPGVGDFHRRIYAVTRALRWGVISTYGDIARQVATVGAARAVGQAMGRNPLPIVIPCHRVIAQSRKIGGFSAHGGAITKERLLAMEGVRLVEELPLLAWSDARH